MCSLGSEYLSCLLVPDPSCLHSDETISSRKEHKTGGLPLLPALSLLLCLGGWGGGTEHTPYVGHVLLALPGITM